MGKIDILTAKVSKFYDAKLDGRADWADWMYDNHVLVVVKNARELSRRFDADEKIVVGASLVHDIADTVMRRDQPGFVEMSLQMATQLLTESSFSSQEIDVIVRDILPNHSCRDGQVLESLEGKVMATADSLAHFNTDFYLVAVYKFAQRGDSMQQIREWALKKLDKDFYKKIFFDEIREETRANYDALKQFFATK